MKKNTVICITNIFATLLIAFTIWVSKDMNNIVALLFLALIDGVLAFILD